MSGPKRNPERRIELLEICFDTFCKYGLENTGMHKLAEACGITNGALIYHFGSKDNIVVESTAHCMAKVEDDFMANAPKSFEDIERFFKGNALSYIKTTRRKIPLYVSGLCKSEVWGIRQRVF